MKPEIRTRKKDIDRTVERLEQVVRVLEELPREKKFNLSCWRVDRTCGTTACAVGWAASDPWFRRRGLHLETDYATARGADFIPVFREQEQFSATRKFFGLGARESRQLFTAGAYKRGSRYDVIRRIRSFCKQLEQQRGAVMSHTPTPWKRSSHAVAGEGYTTHAGIVGRSENGKPTIVARCRIVPDADFIVRACNAHDALTQEKAELLDALRDMVSTNETDDMLQWTRKCARAKAVIASAEGKQ